MVKVTVDAHKELATARGRLLDLCAEAMGLPAREIDDPTGHVPTMESDTAYRARLAARLRQLADAMERNG